MDPILPRLFFNRRLNLLMGNHQYLMKRRCNSNSLPRCTNSSNSAHKLPICVHQGIKPDSAADFISQLNHSPTPPDSTASALLSLIFATYGQNLSLFQPMKFISYNFNIRPFNFYKIFSFFATACPWITWLIK